MTPQLQKILDRLSGVTPCGDQWKAHCPGHPDLNGSLVLSIGEKGGVVGRCFAGCPTEQWLDGIGLKLTDLMPGGSPQAVPEITPREVYRPPDLDLRNRVYSDLLAGLTLSGEHLEQLIKRGMTKPVIDRNQYRSLPVAEGDLGVLERHLTWMKSRYGADLFKVPGFKEDPDGPPLLTHSKGMLIPVRDPLGRIQGFQIRTGEPGRKYTWLSTKENTVGTPVHFPLGTDWPQVQELRVTEGPLKADVATYLGSTCPTIAIPGVSSSSSLLDNLRNLQSKQIRLAFDSDSSTNPAVKNSVISIRSEMEASGFKVEVETWNPQYKGIDDLFLAGEEPKLLSCQEEGSQDPILADDLEIVQLSTVTEEPTNWLWPGWLPAECVTVLDGDPGVGKSHLICDMLSSVTTGRAFPDGTKMEPSNCLILASEDTKASTWKPRCRVAEVDQGRVYFFQSVLDKHGRKVPPCFPEDLENLTRAIRRTQAKLVVFDMLACFITTKLDLNNDQHVKHFMSLLSRVAQETQSAFLCLRHLTKDSSAPSLYRGQGAIGVIGSARVGWGLVRDPDSEHSRDLVLVQIKSNHSAEKRGYRISLTSKTLPSGKQDAAHILWGERLNETTDQFLDRVSQPREKGGKNQKKTSLESCALFGLLCKGPLPVAEVKKRMDALVKANPERCDYVRTQLGVKSLRIDGEWHWQLPLSLADLKEVRSGWKRTEAEG